MGNAASILGNKTIYIIGAVVVTIAKPACEYTAKLVIRGTSDAIDKKLNEICKKLGEINDVQVTQGARLAQLESEIKSDLASIHVEREGAYDNDKVYKLEDDVAAIKDALQKTDASIVRVYDVVEKLPETVTSKYEEVTKKYSTYLHDEHTQIYEAISKFSNVPRRGTKESIELPKKAASLPPSPRAENLPDKLNSVFSKNNVISSGVSTKKKPVLGGVAAAPALPLGPVPGGTNVVKPKA